LDRRDYWNAFSLVSHDNYHGHDFLGGGKRISPTKRLV